MQVAMYLDDGSPSPTYPVAGQEFMPLKTGDVVDVILQNMAANANGDALISLHCNLLTYTCKSESRQKYCT